MRPCYIRTYFVEVSVSIFRRGKRREINLEELKAENFFSIIFFYASLKRFCLVKGLVMLADDLCWTLDDVRYISRNKR